MAKWNLFHRSETKEASKKAKVVTKNVEKQGEKKPDIPYRQESKPIKEYNETLYTSDAKPMKKYDDEHKEPLKRSSWESPRTIEQNIDSMKKTTTDQSGIESHRDSDVNRKVDQVLLKKKMKL